MDGFVAVSYSYLLVISCGHSIYITSLININAKGNLNQATNPSTCPMQSDQA